MSEKWSVLPAGGDSRYSTDGEGRDKPAEQPIMDAPADPITKSTRAGWQGFVRVIAAATAAVAVALILMAIFLL